MTESSAQNTTSDTKLCKVCAEKIQSAARVCIHCSNYQDWRAELSVSSTILSLLVALSSVLTVGVPVISRALTPKNSNLLVNVQGYTDDGVIVLVTNLGIRPGTIGTSAEYFMMNPAYPGNSVSMLLFSDAAPHIVGPSKSELLNFRVTEKSDKKTLYYATECVLSVGILDFYAKQSIVDLSVSCKNFASSPQG
jgi:hypothetical protein